VSVSPFVCLSRRSTAVAAAGGFADEVGRGPAAGRSITAAQHAGRVNFGQTLRWSDQSCPWVGLTHGLGSVGLGRDGSKFFSFLVGWFRLGPL